MSANHSQVTKPGMLSGAAPKLFILAALLMAALVVLQVTGAAQSVGRLFGSNLSPAPAFSSETADRSVHALRASAYDPSEDHGDRLQEVAPVLNVGPWYGAIPQDSPEFNAAASEMQWEIIVTHGDKLQDFVP